MTRFCCFVVSSCCCDQLVSNPVLQLRECRQRLVIVRADSALVFAGKPVDEWVIIKPGPQVTKRYLYADESVMTLHRVWTRREARRCDWLDAEHGCISEYRQRRTDALAPLVADYNFQSSGLLAVICVLARDSSQADVCRSVNST